MRVDSAREVITGFTEGIAKMIETFGTVVIFLLIGLFVAHETHNLWWLLGIGGFGLVGSLLSIYYRSRSAFEASADQSEKVNQARRPRNQDRKGFARVLEAELSVPDEIASKGDWLKGGGSDLHGPGSDSRSPDGDGK